MKRHLPVILILLLIAAGLTAYLATSRSPELPPVPAVAQTDSSPLILTGTAICSVPLTASAIAGILVSENGHGTGMVYNDPWLLEEFCSYMTGQKYTASTDNGVLAYSVLVYGMDGNPLWEMNFGDDRVTFDKDISINGLELKKGTYQSDTGWPNNFPNFFLQLNQGKVINPQCLQYPAKVTVPLEPSVAELCDKGNERVNTYDVLPQMYDFVRSKYAGRCYDVTGSKVLHTYEDMQAETEKVKKTTRCIILTYDSSDQQYILTHPGSQTYQGTTSGYSTLLAKDPQTPGRYTLITDWMVLSLTADSRFDEQFNAIFETNARGHEKLTPDTIQTLFLTQKPYYLEYIGKNLGIPDWSGREPQQVKVQTSPLGSLKNLPYKVVSLSSSFSLRMLVFRDIAQSPVQDFVGYMEFRGWPDTPGYTVKKIGDRIWIYGKQYMGHGTGESHYSQQWYTMTADGIKPALLYNYDDMTAGPYGGYSLKAKQVTIDSKKDLKVTVQYDTSKVYHLFLKGYDDDGMVEFKDSKTAVFNWNEERQKFSSDSLEESKEEPGSYSVSPDTPEIKKKCDKLLKSRGAELESVIKALPNAATEYEKDRKVECLRTFLRDCSDCPEKEALLKKLQEIVPKE